MSAGVARGAKALALACAAALGGCAADRVAGVREASAHPAAPAVPVAAVCPFAVDAVDDARGDIDLGMIGRTRVDGQQFVRWFTDRMAATSGFTRGPAPVRVRIEIAKAYVHGLSSMKSANIVVNARISGPDGQTMARTYRGVDSSMNWWNGEREIQDAFDLALQDLLGQVVPDISRACARPARQG